MIEEQLRELIEAIQAIAPEVWRIMLQQARIEGVMAAFWTVVGLVVGLVSALNLPSAIQRRSYAYLMYMKTHGEEEIRWNAEDDRLIVLVVVLGAAAIVSLAVVLVNIGTAVNALLNPEYYAIQMMLNTLK